MPQAGAVVVPDPVVHTNCCCSCRGHLIICSSVTSPALISASQTRACVLILLCMKAMLKLRHVIRHCLHQPASHRPWCTWDSSVVPPPLSTLHISSASLEICHVHSQVLQQPVLIALLALHMNSLHWIRAVARAL